LNIVPAQNETSTAAAPLNRLYLWMVASTAALGGFLFGYDWVVIGGAKPFYEKFFTLTTPAEQGWAMSCALIGCLLGASASGPLSERFGRKNPLILSASIFCLSSIGTGLANSFHAFVVWRILGGFAIGLASSLSPVYIAELAPAELRGKLVSLNQLTVVCGILLAQIVNWLIARPIPATATANDILQSWNGQTGWRWMFGATAVPSILFLVAMFFVPESPRWLSRHGAPAKARQVLTAIGGPAYGDAVFAEIESSIAAEQNAALLHTLFEPKNRPVLWLGIILAVLQQWCGINVIFNYAEEVFSAAGFAVSDILFNIVVTGAVNVVFTVLALRTVDHYGRRVMMLGGFAGLGLIYTLLGVLYHFHSRGVVMLVLVVAAIACYAISLAPVTWVVISEIFPSRIRGAAVAIAVTALWAACFVLTYSFPFLNQMLGAAGTFWIYAGVCALGFIYLSLRLPETKGKSLENIEQSWNEQSWR
jgi:sugar porter (SP) family MFS transporter